MKFPRILIPISILMGLSYAIHRYVWMRLVRDAIWPNPWGHALTILIFFLGASIPVVFLSMRHGSRTWTVPLSWVVYTWMGLLFYLLLFSALGDAAWGLASLAKLIPADAAQRLLWSRVLAIGIGSLTGLFGVAGFWNVARGFTVQKVRVPLDKFPAGASYRIVQLSDVHVGPTIGRAFVESLVQRTNALNPDLIAITGDLIDGSVSQLRALVEPLRDLKAKDGVFFVTGNHEYYSGAGEWVSHLQTLGIRVLRNERVTIRGLFELAGVDDYRAQGMLPGHGQDIAKATQGRDPARALVLLAHQPKAVQQAVAAGVDLQLSGHVHGGQMFPFNFLARMDQPLITGLYKRGETWVYVSEGTGYWGPPMRIGTRSEITELELVSGKT